MDKATSFRYYNAHPYKRSVDDCVKRSISLTTGIPYLEVQKGLNAHKRITGAKIFYQKGNPRSYLENVLGFPCRSVARASSDMPYTVEKFAKEHPTGRYIVSVLGHWTSCIDGVVYDTWDCRSMGVLSFYEITRFKRTLVERKYCFTVEDGQITVYDGNGNFAARQLSKEAASEYIERLYDRGFFCFDEMDAYI